MDFPSHLRVLRRYSVVLTILAQFFWQQEDWKLNVFPKESGFFFQQDRTDEARLTCRRIIIQVHSWKWSYAMVLKWWIHQTRMKAEKIICALTAMLWMPHLHSTMETQNSASIGQVQPYTDIQRGGSIAVSIAFPQPNKRWVLSNQGFQADPQLGFKSPSPT